MNRVAVEFFFVEIFVGRECHDHDQDLGEDVLARGEGKSQNQATCYPANK